MEFLAGIPGTIGGAVRMNAGAYGGEIKDILVKTTYLNENLEIKEFSNEAQEFSYRHSIFCENPDFIILETELKLEKDLEENINSRIDEMMKNRIEKQPINYPSAGSTFKRLPNKVTAKLIDECGFIINTGNDTAKDVLTIVENVKTKVYERFNEIIELEVIVVGEE